MLRAAFRMLSALTLASLLVFVVVGMRPATAAAQDRTVTTSTCITKNGSTTCETCYSFDNGDFSCNTETTSATEPAPQFPLGQECLNRISEDPFAVLFPPCLGLSLPALEQACSLIPPTNDPATDPCEYFRS